MVAQERRGLSVLEALLATVLVSTAVLAYLSLSAQETRWTQDLDDRAKAVAIAQNMLIICERDFHHLFYNAPKDDSGAYVMDNALITIPDASIAIGVLFDWAKKKTDHGGFSVKMGFLPSPPSLSGSGVQGVAKLTCRVQWKTERGDVRWVELPSIVPL